MATDLNSVDLKAVVSGGQIHEELLNKIYDISPEDLPFTNAVSKGSAPKNTECTWIVEKLAPASSSNVLVEGADATGDDSVVGVRVGNHAQISGKTITVSRTLQQIDTVGGSNEMIRQIEKRQRELRRDVEASLTSRNPAVIRTGVVGGESAGIGSWVGVTGANNSDRGVGGADPILSATTGGIPTTAPVAGATRALSETLVRSMDKATYDNGGMPSLFMSRPEVTAAFSDYLFTGNARIGQMRTQTSGSATQDSNGGKELKGITADGNINTFVSNFSTLKLCPNRFQPEVAAGVADVYLIDPALWELSFIAGYQVNELAKTGDADKRQMIVEYFLKSFNEEGNAVIADIDTTIPVVL